MSMNIWQSFNRGVFTLMRKGTALNGRNRMSQASSKWLGWEGLEILWYPFKGVSFLWKTLGISPGPPYAQFMNTCLWLI